MAHNTEVCMEINELLAQESNYAMEYKFSSAFSRLTGRPETGVLTQIRGLAKRNEADMSGRGKYERSLRSAIESIWHWYETSSDYALMSTDVAINMIESHDPACVWAVMLGQANREVR